MSTTNPTGSKQQQEYEYPVRDYREPEFTEFPDEYNDSNEYALLPSTLKERQALAEGQIRMDKDNEWLRRARDAYTNSTNYIETSLRQTWERNWKMFRNEHAAGSKYNSAAYANRSRIFRPKLRSASTKRLAMLSSALHASDDLLSVSPQNQANADAKASADIHKELLQHRLTHTIPWFQVSIGAYQSCDIYNICISRQDWNYRVVDESTYEHAKDEDGEPIYDADGVTPMGYKTEKHRVIDDEPSVVLIKPENFRFDPNSDWIDVIKSSPYLIEIMPMFAGDVLAHMDTINPATGEPQWRKLELGSIVTAGRIDNLDNETVRQAREGEQRRDPVDAPAAREDTLVSVRRYIIRDGFTDWTFYTLGSTHLLTDPVPLESVSLLGRNYVAGFNSIEVFRSYPSSAMELGTSLQEEINDTSNQRLDNVKLVLNKRYFIKRQKQGSVDLQSLMRNVPGGGILVDDPSQDVKVIDTPDVTASSYQENDRLSVELDELLGNFSQSTVQSNRNLNETVGGMNMMSEDANVVQEFSFKLFVTTWVQPVLRQLIKLEAKYETDETVLALAGQKAEVYTSYGVSEITDKLLNEELIVKVNVGMGHTNPTQKLQKLSTGVNLMLSMPEGPTRLNFDAVSKEAWGYLGFADGERFTIPAKDVKQSDPMADPEIQLKAQDIERRTQADQRLAEFRETELISKREMEMTAMASKEGLKTQEIEARTGVDFEKLKFQRDATALRETNKSRELHIKTKTGSGI